MLQTFKVVIFGSVLPFLVKCTSFLHYNWSEGQIGQKNRLLEPDGPSPSVVEMNPKVHSWWCFWLSSWATSSLPGVPCFSMKRHLRDRWQGHSSHTKSLTKFQGLSRIFPGCQSIIPRFPFEVSMTSTNLQIHVSKVNHSIINHKTQWMQGYMYLAKGVHRHNVTAIFVAWIDPRILLYVDPTKKISSSA